MIRFDTALVVKVAAAGFAVLAITLAAVELGQDEGAEPRGAPHMVADITVLANDAPDPLASELTRCRAITDPAAVDDGCRRAWAERRARFFGPRQDSRP